jgi:magnesium-transporting ATPase (P-type)
VLPAAEALRRLGSSELGLSSVEASRRLRVYGPNVLLSHGVSALSVLVRQLRSYLLLLLLVAAVVSALVGDLTESLISPASTYAPSSDRRNEAMAACVLRRSGLRGLVGVGLAIRGRG